MTKIVAFAGKKQSGKSTCCNYIHGHELKSKNILENFKINQDGSLSVSALHTDENGNVYTEMGVLDLNQRDDRFFSYAEQMIWPFVRLYNLSDALKDICAGLFDLKYEQMFGTDEDKNTLTNLSWEDMPVIVNDRKGKMTAREVLQYFGSEICRKMNKSCWTNIIKNRILEESPEIAVIGDVRFKNEFEAIKEMGGRVIFLTRNSNSNDSHISENDLTKDNMPYDFILDNENISIDESTNRLCKYLISVDVLKILRRESIITIK